MRRSTVQSLSFQLVNQGLPTLEGLGVYKQSSCVSLREGNIEIVEYT
jgi:hypothetical protein